MEEETSHVELLFEKTGDYARKKVELYKLKAVDKTTDVVSSVAADIAVVTLLFFFFIIINIGLALWLGELMGRTYYGFFTVAGFYALTGILFYTFREKLIKHPVRNSLIKHILKIN